MKWPWFVIGKRGIFDLLLTVMVKSKQLMDGWMDDGWGDFMNMS